MRAKFAAVLLVAAAVGVGHQPACAVQVLSELYDYTHEPGALPHLDIVRARVLQVDHDLIQFEMEVAGPIPRDPGPSQEPVCYWRVDADKNIATGERLGDTGAEYIVRAVWHTNPYAGQAYVDALPGGSPAPFGFQSAPMFIADNVVRVLVRTDQLGGVTSFRWNCEAWSWDGSHDYIFNAEEATLSTNYRPAGAPARVTVDANACLRDGLSAMSVHPRIYDGTGQRLSSAGLSISLCAYQNLLTTSGEFIYAQPGKVGLTHVTALVDGVVSYNKCAVMVGSLLLRPSIIYLDNLAQMSGWISVEARDAYAAPVPLTGHLLEWYNDSPDVASISSGGFVQALPAGEGRTDWLHCTFDGQWLNNSCGVRVVKGAVLTPQPSEYRGRWVSFWLPGSISVIPQGMTLDQFMQQWDVLKATDVAYRTMYHLTRVVGAFGDRQDLDAVHEDDWYRVCGGSGNPIQLGFDVRVPGSCIQHSTYGPHMVMWHELGHNFPGSSPVIMHGICSGPTPSINAAYNEGLAGLMKLCAMQRIVYGPRNCGVNQTMVDALLDSRLVGSLPFDRITYVEGHLATYVANGSRYDTISPDVLDGIWIVLADEYGWEIYPRFFSAFLPPDVPLPLGFVPQTETDRATLFVAALSAAAGEDLRPRFRDEWGFPVDDELYASLYPHLAQRIADRAYEHYQRFDDVPDTNSAVAHIAAITDAGIATGTSTSPPLFSPWAGVTRDQMAVFLCRAAEKEPLDKPTPTFADVPKTHWAYGYIERLADAASWGGSPPTNGCRADNPATPENEALFCPGASVTREQMAKFLCLAAGKPPMPSCSGVFADVGAGGPSCRFIERIADPASWPGKVAVTSGCACPGGYPPGARCFCPRSPITRSQTAVFLVRAFGLPL